MNVLKNLQSLHRNPVIKKALIALIVTGAIVLAIGFLSRKEVVGFIGVIILLLALFAAALLVEASEAMH